MIDPQEVPPSKEETLEAINQDITAFNEFFSGRLGQSPASRMEMAYLRTYLCLKLLGQEEMTR